MIMIRIEFFLLILLALITAVNIHIYKLIRQKYFGVLRQIWRLERYIKEIYNATRCKVS